MRKNATQELGASEDESVYALPDDAQGEVDSALEELEEAAEGAGTEAMVRSARLLADRIRKEANEPALELWQEQLCDWMASQAAPGKLLPKDIRTVASALADRVVKYKELTKLRARATWRMRWEKRRQSLLNADLADSREQAIKLVGKGMTIYDEMLDTVRKDKDARAFAPLGVPLLDRALPKKLEGSVVATQITITLTPEQAAGLDGPIAVIEAVEQHQLPATVE